MTHVVVIVLKHSDSTVQCTRREACLFFWRWAILYNIATFGPYLLIQVDLAMVKICKTGHVCLYDFWRGAILRLPFANTDSQRPGLEPRTQWTGSSKMSKCHCCFARRSQYMTITDFQTFFGCEGRSAGVGARLVQIGEMRLETPQDLLGSSQVWTSTKRKSIILTLMPGSHLAAPAARSRARTAVVV